MALAAHLLPKLSAQLAFTLHEKIWIEDVEDAGFDQLGALTHPTGVVFANSWAGKGLNIDRLRNRIQRMRR